MNFTVPIYQRKQGGLFEWTTVGLGPFTRTRRGTLVPKLQQAVIADLRKVVETDGIAAVRFLTLKRGTYLRRVRVEIAVGEGKKKKLSGLLPLVLEPHDLGTGELLIAYHPARQQTWFPVDAGQSLGDQAAKFVEKAFPGLDEEGAEQLFSDEKDLLRALSFAATPPSLLDQLDHRKKGPFDDLAADPAQRGKPRTKSRVLATLGVDRSARREGDGEGCGAPRSPYRERLSMLLGGKDRRSVMLVGPPRVGKSILVERFVDDLLIGEDFLTHRNLDKTTHVWEISGKRLIAGMSYVGEWEQRLSELLDEVRGKRVILYIPDLHAFGRLGQARDSTRSFADVFRGPMARGEVTVISECTASQLSRLEEDAPTLAPLLTRVQVTETTEDETFRLLLRAARLAEAETEDLVVQPMALRTLLELGSALFPGKAMPGKVLDELADIVRDFDTEEGPVTEGDVVSHLAVRTGIPGRLLRLSTPLPRGEVEAGLTARVMGQEGPVRVVSDLALRVKSGLNDPRRPLGVYLFTGPTGTGKTELAKALAETLFGSTRRLVRFDMGEYSGADAAARLLGDSFDGEGQLTRALSEQPFSVLLFDEVEKAHPSVLYLFLQLFDEGRLTSATGETLSAASCVIVMTSNLGARRDARAGFGEDDPAGLLADVARAVREFFPKELWNRIDQVVPFAPLTHAVALQVTEKELARLLARRGLTSRKVLVQTGRDVFEAVAREAFAEADGARSLKRFLEDRIGARVSEEIAARPDAALRVLHLSATSEGFSVRDEPLVEAAPVPLPSVLEPLVDADLGRLLAHLSTRRPVLEALRDGPVVEQLGARIAAELSAHRGQASGEGAEVIFQLDLLRARFASLVERLEGALVDERELSRSELARRHEERALVEIGAKWDYRRHEVRTREARGADLAESRLGLLSLAAEAAFLERLVERPPSVDRFTASVLLAPLGPVAPGRGTMLSWLAEAYAGAARSDPRARTGASDAAALEEFAVLREDGSIEEGRTEPQLRTAMSRFGPRLSAVALRLVGLGALDLLSDEHGTHVHEPALGLPQIVRVAVASGAGEPARRRAEAEREAREAHVRVGTSAPLLPLVRRVRAEATARGVQAFDIEDYPAAFAGRLFGVTLGAALSPLFLLRLGRELA